MERKRCAQRSYLVQKLGPKSYFGTNIIASNFPTATSGAHFVLPTGARQSLKITQSGAQKAYIYTPYIFHLGTGHRR